MGLYREKILSSKYDFANILGSYISEVCAVYLCSLTMHEVGDTGVYTTKLVLTLMR